MEASAILFVLILTTLSVLQVPASPVEGQTLFAFVERRENCQEPNPRWKCRVGSRGPCAEGQIFTLISKDANYDVRDVRILDELCSEDDVPEECSVSSQRPTIGDDNAFVKWKSEFGVCLWSREDHPCKGSPSHYRYNSDKGKCDPVDCFRYPRTFIAVTDSEHIHYNPDPEDEEFCSIPRNKYPELETSNAGRSGNSIDDDFRSPSCPGDKVFRTLNETHGQCQCRQNFGTNYQVLWPADDQCYGLNTQGPCHKGQWLIWDKEAVCKATKCRTDGSRVEVVDDNGVTGCHRLQHRGPCPAGQALTRFQKVVKCWYFGGMLIPALVHFQSA